MHAHRISVLSNIQFKLSLLFTFSVLTTIITQEIFFSPLQRVFTWCGAGVITRAILVSCMLCSKASSPLFPLSHPEPSGRSPRQQTAILCLAIVSLIPAGFNGRSQSLKAYCGFCCDKWPFLPLLFLIWTFPSTPKTRLKNAASFLLKGLSGGCCFSLTPARE